VKTAGSEHGFSLIEVMVTLSVMALAAGMVATAVAGISGFGKARSDPAHALWRLASIIETALAAPASAGGLNRVAPVFGDATSLSFLTATDTSKGLIANRFTATSAGLQWDQASVRNERDIVDAIYPADAAIIVEQLSGLRFAYRRRGDADWRAAWPVGPHAPDIISVQVTANGGRKLRSIIEIRRRQ